MKQIVDLLQRDIGGISLGSIGFAFFVLIATLISRKLFDTYIKRGLKLLTDKTKTKLDGYLLDAIGTPVSAIIMVVGFYYAVIVLKLPAEPYDIEGFMTVAFNIAISAIIIWSLFRVSNVLAQLLMGIFSKMDREMADNFAPLITQAVKITVIGIGILVVIQNLGYSIGSILAGLGIGGLAIALAAQDTIANLFGTFVMIIDKPFKVGDWVRFRDIDGDVESIGFRSTKVRTWEKTLKILPNKLLTSEVIENFSEMPKRRVSVKIGIPYSTSPDKVLALRDRMESILLDDPDVDQDYLFVYFDNFAPSALEIFVYYFTKTTVWKQYLQVRQNVNIKFMRAASELGISFAFPSQTVYFGDTLSVKNTKDNKDEESISS